MNGACLEPIEIDTTTLIIIIAGTVVVVRMRKKKPSKGPPKPAEVPTLSKPPGASPTSSSE